MFQTLKEDAQTVFTKDPAARSLLEVFICYPPDCTPFGLTAWHIFCGATSVDCWLASSHTSTAFLQELKSIPELELDAGASSTMEPE